MVHSPPASPDQAIEERRAAGDPLAASSCAAGRQSSGGARARSGSAEPARFDQVTTRRAVIFTGGQPVRLPDHRDGWRWEPYAVDGADVEAVEHRQPPSGWPPVPGRSFRRSLAGHGRRSAAAADLPAVRRGPRPRRTRRAPGRGCAPSLGDEIGNHTAAGWQTTIGSLRRRRAAGTPHLLTAAVRGRHPLRPITCAASGRSSRVGGRRGCHGTAATAAGRCGVVPLEGDLGERPGRSPRTSVPVRPWRANVRGWRRRLWGGWSSQASTRSRLARAATTCRRRAWHGQRVSPVVPPAGAEVVPAGTADRGDALGGVSAVSVPYCGGSRESATNRLAVPAAPVVSFFGRRRCRWFRSGPSRSSTALSAAAKE